MHAYLHTRGSRASLFIITHQTEITCIHACDAGPECSFCNEKRTNGFHVEQCTLRMDEMHVGAYYPVFLQCMLERRTCMCDLQWRLS